MVDSVGEETGPCGRERSQLRGGALKNAKGRHSHALRGSVHEELRRRGSVSSTNLIRYLKATTHPHANTLPLLSASVEHARHDKEAGSDRSFTDAY